MCGTGTPLASHCTIPDGSWMVNLMTRKISTVFTWLALLCFTGEMLIALLQCILFVKVDKELNQQF